MDTMLVTRTVIDAGIEVELAVPQGWMEYKIPGTIVALGESREESQRRFASNVILRVESASSGESAFSTIRQALQDLPESSVAIDQEGDRHGLSALFMGTAYKHEEVGSQAMALLALFVPGATGLVVIATGVAAGDANGPEMSLLSKVVGSLSVRRLQE